MIKTVHVVTFERVFNYRGHTGWGFGFDCNEAGIIDESTLCPEARENLRKCLSGEHDVTDDGVRRYERTYRIHLCDCGSGLESEWEYDGRGIELCRACDRCRTQKLAKYNPAILRHYTQADIDEPIEAEE